jgi:ParB family chromosome partitioning protein
MAKRKALGSGLNSLFPEEVTGLEEIDSTEKVEQIALSELTPNPYQPRKDFSEESLAELAASIKQDGVFQPIIVTPNKVRGYYIIAGERRFRASKMAGLETIPAIVREFSDHQMIQVAILENLQREDLNPLEEAQAYDMMMQNMNLTQNEVADRLGKSRPYIANYLRMLSMPDMVKQLIAKGELKPGQAKAILGLKDKKQIVGLAEKTVKEGLTVRQLEEIVKKMNEAATAAVPKKPKTVKSIYIRESEDALMDKFGTSVNISDKGNKGKIEIEYVSQSDLNRILDLLDIHISL